MKELVRYLGVIVLLLGVVLLALPAFGQMDQTNGTLLGGLGLVIGGMLLHIILNKVVAD